MKVGYIVGSLSKGSINRQLALALADLAHARTGLQFREIPISPLALYDRERHRAVDQKRADNQREQAECGEVGPKRGRELGERVVLAARLD